MYDIVCRAEGKALFDPLLLVLWYLVSHTHSVPVPTATGVGKIKCVCEICVHHWFVINSKDMNIICFPYIQAIPG